MNIEDTQEEVQPERIHHGRGRRRMAAPTVTGRSPEYYNWIPLTSGNHEISYENTYQFIYIYSR